MQDFKEIAFDIVQLVVRKEKDYSSSYDKVRARCGPPAFHTRLWDKLARIEQVDVAYRDWETT